MACAELCRCRLRTLAARAGDVESNVPAGGYVRPLTDAVAGLTLHSQRIATGTAVNVVDLPSGSATARPPLAPRVPRSRVAVRSTLQPNRCGTVAVVVGCHVRRH